MRKQFIFTLILMLAAQAVFAGGKKYPNVRELQAGIEAAMQRNGGLSGLSSKINFARIGRLPKRSDGLQAWRRALHKEAGAYKGFNIGNTMSALAVMGYESKEATNYLLYYFREEAKDTFLEPAATLLLYRAAKHHNMQDLAAEMEEEGVLAIGKEDVAWLEPWVKNRGPLARTTADLSDEAAQVWTGYVAVLPPEEVGHISSLIHTRPELTQYASQLSENEMLQNMMDKDYRTMLAFELTKHLQTSNPSIISEKLSTYSDLFEDIGTVLRQIKVDMISVAEEETHPFNKVEIRDWLRKVVALRNELQAQTVYLYEIPEPMQQLMELLREISDQYLEAMQRVATAG